MADLVRAIRSGTPHRADGRLALHVLEALLATEESIRTEASVPVASRAPATALLPAGWTLAKG